MARPANAAHLRPVDPMLYRHARRLMEAGWRTLRVESPPEIARRAVELRRQHRVPVTVILLAALVEGLPRVTASRVLQIQQLRESLGLTWRHIRPTETTPEQIEEDRRMAARGTWRKWTPDRIEKFRQAIASRRPLDEIAAEFDLAPHSILPTACYLRTRYGVPFPSRVVEPRSGRPNKGLDAARAVRP